MAGGVRLWKQKRAISGTWRLCQYQTNLDNVGEADLHRFSRSNCGQTIAKVSHVNHTTVVIDIKLIARHVFQHAYNVWRDPRLVDDEGNSICDSCFSAVLPPKEEYHLFDSVLVEEKHVTPLSTSLLWRVARIIQVDSRTIKVQLFERYSDRAQRMKEPGYVSEVRQNPPGLKRDN